MAKNQVERVEQLKNKALEMRKRLLRLCHEGAPLHIGGDLSPPEEVPRTGRSRCPSSIVTLMGDGELNEGSVWEGVMAAAHFGLGNLVAFIDKNDLSMDGRLDDVMRMNPIGDKFAAFGWNVVEIDGHDMAALVEVIDSLPDAMSSRPTVVVASTVKGKGVGFMENSVAWHAGAIDADTLKATVAEVEEKRQREREGVLNS